MTTQQGRGETDCPNCGIQAKSLQSFFKAHFVCERCHWAYIVADTGKIFKGTDASDKCLAWINEPDEIGPVDE